MNLTRRGFMKATGAAFATSMAFQLTQQSPALAVESNSDWKLVNTEEYTNICCYCAGGCGSLLSVRDGELINLEGDPDHPINQGGLCPKGAAMFQLRNIVDPETREVIKNPDRVTKPMVRRPGASEWEDITWEDAVKEIAQPIAIGKLAHNPISNEPKPATRQVATNTAAGGKPALPSIPGTTITE